MTLSKRLSIGLAFSLVLLLAVQWGVASFLIGSLTRNQLESRLAQDSESLLAGMSFNEQGQLLLDPRRVNTVYQRPLSGHYYVAIAGSQRQVSRSLWDGDLDIPNLKPGMEARLRVSGPEKQMLLITAHGYRKQNQDITIAVAEDLTSLNAGLRQFQLIYGAVSLAILIALLLIQHLIVRNSLRPLQLIKTSMARLERGEIDRIETLGPAEIAPVLHELNRLLANMGKQTRRSRDALGNLAHALKTQLTILNQVAEQLEISAHSQLRSSIHGSSEAMRHIVERELKRARLVGDALPGRRVDVRDEITLLVQTLELMYVDKTPDISWTVADGAHFIGDQEDFFELLGNLLDNACKWCNARVLLTVNTANGISFVIEDDGAGCEPEELDRLTRRGFRADESKPGSGLGLAIVRDIVESYGGTLSFGRSAELGGLRVEVWLPGLSVST